MRVVLLLDKQQVWPATTLELKAAKLLHEFQLGENMSVKQLLGDESENMVKRAHTEFEAVGVKFSFGEVADTVFEFDEVRIFGLQWEPEAFMEQACKVSHPLSLATALPSELADAMCVATEQGFHTVAKRCADFFKFWSKRANELSGEEAKFREV